MKKNILLLLITSLLITTADAQAPEEFDESFSCEEIGEPFWLADEAPFYAGVLCGANFLQNTTINGNKTSYQTGYILGCTLGYCWCDGLRLEAEYAYRRNEISKIHFYLDDSSRHGHYQSSSCMANLLWDLPLPWFENPCYQLQSYVGAGIGYDFQQMKASNSRIVFNQRWNHFSWQLMAGLSYLAFCNTEISLEYDYHRGGSHFNNHSLYVGLVYKFDPVSSY